MTLRSVSWLAAAALAATAAPALAQDGRYHPGPPPPLPQEGVWEDEWEEDLDDGYEDPDWQERREVHGDAHDARPGEWRSAPMHGHEQVPGQAP